MRTVRQGFGFLLLAAFAALSLFDGSAYAATVETRKGERIPGRIVGEGEKEFKVETDLPGGGKIIFNVDKDKVDPHGTVRGKGRIEDIGGTA